MIEKIINKNSSNKKLFEQTKTVYNEALERNGYTYAIKYTEKTRRKKNR